MNSFSKITTVLIAITLLSWNVPENISDANLLVSKSTVEKKQKKVLMIFYNGSYNLQISENDSMVESFTGNLNSDDLSALKKLIKKSRVIQLKDKYDCENGINRDSYTMLFIDDLNYKRNMLIGNNCTLPKRLHEVSHFLDSLMAKE